MQRKLCTTFGIELSFVSSYYTRILAKLGCRNEDDFSIIHHIHNTKAEILKVYFYEKKIPVFRCDTDPTCVEISTKPHKTVNSLMYAVRHIWKAAHLFELETSSPYTTGGGLHIHVGKDKIVPKDQFNEFKRHLLTFAAKNPWLCWAFLHPEDDANESPVSPNDINYNESYRTKCISTCTKYLTIEFRAFEMPDTIEDVEKYILLVDSILRYCKSKLGTPINMEELGQLSYYGNIPTLPYSTMKAGFHAMLLELGMNPDDFRKETVTMALRKRYYQRER